MKTPATTLPNFDMRAEVLARLLMQEHGLRAEQLLHNPIFYHQRRGRRDVAAITEGFSARADQRTLCIETSREGLFDTLPEAIFLHPEDDYGNEVEKMRQLTAQEAAARKFFAPFEQLFFWMRIEAEEQEWRTENHLGQWWANAFEDGKEAALSAHQRETLVEMLPYLSEIVGNWGLTEQWLGILLSRTVRIQVQEPQTYPLPGNIQLRMGEARLGLDFVIGQTFSDGVPVLGIFITDLGPDEIVPYLPGGASRRVLEDEILAWLLPVETPFDIRLGLVPSQQRFRVAADSQSDVLGYNILL